MCDVPLKTSLSKQKKKKPVLLPLNYFLNLGFVRWGDWLKSIIPKSANLLPKINIFYLLFSVNKPASLLAFYLHFFFSSGENNTVKKWSPSRTTGQYPGFGRRYSGSGTYHVHSTLFHSEKFCVFTLLLGKKREWGNNQSKEKTERVESPKTTYSFIH